MYGNRSLKYWSLRTRNVWPEFNENDLVYSNADCFKENSFAKKNKLKESVFPFNLVVVILKGDLRNLCGVSLRINN